MVGQVGGPEEAYKAAGSLFSAMGKNTIYCGSSGTGSVSYYEFNTMEKYFSFSFDVSISVRMF